MRLPAPFSWSDEHISIALAGAQALFTTRRGGASRGAYESLNLGRWTDDDPVAVARNRDLVQERAGSAFAFGRQVHGSHVAPVDAPTVAPAEADGQLTARRGLAPMVLTADCLPVALAGGGAVAMLHAGWRGLIAGILPAGVRAMREVTADGTQLTAAIGPGAGPCCYEVSEEVHARFAERESDLRQGARLDLKAIAALELERAGVGQVHDVSVCTICAEESLFFSHRRDAGRTGRQAGVAWLS